MSQTEVTRELLAGWPIPPVAEATDKEARGRVFVLGGGAQVAGAAILAGVAALRTGAGKLRIGAPKSVATSLALALPEARVFPLPETGEGEPAPNAADLLVETISNCDAVVVGPGLLDETSAGGLALRVLEADGPILVADAAAMPALVRSPEHARRKAGRLILTPHAGEMAGLLDRPKSAIEADPAAAARELATSLQAVVVLKGAVTIIVSPQGQLWRHEGGSRGLATSGSGDVLAGVIAGLAARGAASVQAAVWGVHVHGQAGRRLAERIAPVGFLARELLDEIAPVLGELEGTAE